MWAGEANHELAMRAFVREWNANQRVSAMGMLRSAVAVGIVAAFLFVAFPAIDLDVTRIFYSAGANNVGTSHFLGNRVVLFDVLRQLFNAFFYLVCATTLAGAILSSRGARSWLGIGSSKWMFVAMCLVVGPLVVANIGFKDHWGRARPRDVVEFSGNKAFTPPLPPSLQCQYNCSFVSGEASSIFIVFFASAFLFGAWARNVITAGILMGGLAGLTRISQGAHFLSDVVFAGVFMAVTAAVLQLLFDIIKSANRAELAELVENRMP